MNSVGHAMVRTKKPRRRLAEMLALSFLFIIFVSVPIFLIRWIRQAELSLITSDLKAKQSEALQFGIVSLLKITFLVAGVTAVVQYFSRFSFNETWVLMLWLAVSLSTCSLVAIWSMLGNSPRVRSFYSAIFVLFLSAFNFLILRENSAVIFAEINLGLWFSMTIFWDCCGMKAIVLSSKRSI